VLWLDQLDQWLPDGLSAGLPRRCRDSKGVRVVATISTRQHRQWAARRPELFAE
jgi:hypothetical protein